MLFRRIPILLLSGEGLVKTTKFKDPKYVGDPRNAVRIFNEKEVDELIFLDIEATKKNQHPNFDIISEIADECFMPLAYGGGIKSIDSMKRLFDIGIEKVIVNSVLDTDPGLVEKAASIFGSQSVVASIDVKYSLFRKPIIHVECGRRALKVNLAEWIQRVQSLGVGEIMIMSIDRDGVRKGMDIELTRTINDLSKVPVISAGGVGSLSDIGEVRKQTGVSAVGAGSFFVFQGKHRAVLITYPDRNKIEEINYK